MGVMKYKDSGGVIHSIGSIGPTGPQGPPPDPKPLAYTKAALASDTIMVSIPTNVWADCGYFNVEVEDSHGMWNPLFPNYFTIPHNGLYEVSATIVFAHSTVGHRYLRFLVDGVAAYNRVARISQTAPVSAANSELRLTQVLRLQAGQKVSVQAFQSSGVSLNVRIQGDEQAVMWVRELPTDVAVVDTKTVVENPVGFVGCTAAVRNYAVQGTFGIKFSSFEENSGGFVLENGNVRVPYSGIYEVSITLDTYSAATVAYGVTSYHVNYDGSYTNRDHIFGEMPDMGYARVNTFGSKFLRLNAGDVLEMVHSGAVGTYSRIFLYLQLVAKQTSGPPPTISPPYVYPGDTEWKIPAMLNGWVNYDTPVPGVTFAPATYRKDALGFVHLQGLIKFGTSNNIFVLPPGYRPNYKLIFNTMFVGNAAGRINVLPDGTVLQEVLSSAWQSLNNIDFLAER